jgi:hypothetical protein
MTALSGFLVLRLTTVKFARRCIFVSGRIASAIFAIVTVLARDSAGARRNRDKYFLRPQSRHWAWSTVFANPPSENRNPAMIQTAPQLPDLSVDFLTWINAELRRQIEGPNDSEEEEGEKSGFVNRLKAYLGRD